MAKSPARTGTAPFAHLLALVTGKSAAPKGAEDERDDEEAAADDENDDTDAEDETPAEDAENEGTEEEAESDDEDVDAEDDDEEKEAKAFAQGFAAAQERGRKIFGAAAAGVRPDMAAHFAFNETMSAKKAIAMLDLAATGAAAPAPTGSRLARRMARVVLPNPGVGGGKKKEEMSFGEMAKAAGKKAGIFS